MWLKMRNFIECGDDDFEHHIALPTTSEEYDALVDKIIAKFEIENRDHASAVISVAIRRLPNDQPVTTLKYLIGCIVKSLANGIANHKHSLIEHASQITILKETIKAEPGDQEAIDKLQKAANEGSELAKNAMRELFPDQVN